MMSADDKPNMPPVKGAMMAAWASPTNIFVVEVLDPVRESHKGLGNVFLDRHELSPQNNTRLIWNDPLSRIKNKGLWSLWETRVLCAFSKARWRPLWVSTAPAASIGGAGREDDG